MTTDDLLFRPDEEEDLVLGSGAEPWPILVVDDDQQVHRMTRVLLRDFEFDGRAFEVISALSASEAKAILAERPDIPVALLDVVMETDDAGLRLVRHIRETLGNTRMRIILRTGQPGQAPEREVVVGYDINDYKAKSELTAQKLFTALVGALRSWRDIVTIERNRMGLERILDASATLLEQRSMRALVEGLVGQLGRVADSAGGSVLACRDTDRGDRRRQIAVVAASGRYSGHVGKPVADCLALDLIDAVTDAFETQASVYGTDRCVLAFRTMEHGTTVFVVERPDPFTTDDHRLLELFCSRVAIGFDNVCLYEDLLALNRSLEQRVADRTAELAANQKALIASKQRLEKALEREVDAKHHQRQFLTMVSHEFRTPLAIIDSAAQMLSLRAEAVEPGMLDRLSVIRTSVQRLTGLIEVYLTDERLESGNLVLDAADLDLPELLRAMVEGYRIGCPGQAFVLDIDALPQMVSGDAHLLGLAFTNLINNAVKYSDQAAIRVAGRRDGAFAVVEVRDRGRGIPEAEIPRVFERFFRGGNASGVPGTGIGLHTVQQIVELHGGTVTVDSALGEGSTFRVTLPCPAPAGPTGPAAPAR